MTSKRMVSFAALLILCAGLYCTAEGQGIRAQHRAAGVPAAYAGYPFLAWPYFEFSRVNPRPFNNTILPHFALYPPVYYSHPVGRPYGFSPFALPPGIPPVEPSLEPTQSAAKEIINPYYKPEEKAADAVPANTVQWIENPYVHERVAADMSVRVLP